MKGQITVRTDDGDPMRAKHCRLRNFIDLNVEQSKRLFNSTKQKQNKILTQTKSVTDTKLCKYCTQFCPNQKLFPNNVGFSHRLFFFENSRLTSSVLAAQNFLKHGNARSFQIIFKQG